ncbi:MAG: Holliday junction resolvase RuvX [Marinobacter sp.]|nr:Holliday junction resolvase RuvX [Marinobacter sp.]
MLESGQRRVMAFDYGLRRIGVAVGQELLGTAQPLQMLTARDGIPDWALIGRLLAEWQPDLLVVGLPLNMDGSESDMCARARKFANRLNGRFNLPIALMDERLTSYEAKGEVLAQGGSRDFARHGVDDRAAVLILESWFAEAAAGRH